MKISEMKLDAGFDVMEKILPDVASILQDDEVKAAKAAVKSNGDHVDIGGNIAPIMRLFLGKHRAAMIRIVGTICGKTADEVREMDVGEFLATAQSCINEDMVGFFGCCLRMVMTA